MHVLHAIPTLEPAYGGPTQALVGLVTAQRQEGLDARIIATLAEGEDESLVETLERSSVPMTLLRGCRGPLRSHPELPRRVRAAIEHADVVHIHTVWEQIQHVAAVASRQQNKPYIVRPCGMLSVWALQRHSRLKRLKKQVYYYWRLRRTLRRAAAIHFTTEFEQEQAMPLGIDVPAIVEPSGIDMSAFEGVTPTGEFRRQHGLESRPLIVFLGRIFPGKGLEVLVPAMARVQPADAVLAIVGPDSDGYQRTVESMITEHGLHDRVIFTGPLSGTEKIAALADADIFSLPSEHENFGLVVVEALAAGTPVVISDTVGVHHLINKGGVGSVVPRDPDRLGQEISRWLSDRRRLAEAAERARPFVQEHFTWERIARRWCDHYRHIADRSAGAAG